MLYMYTVEHRPECPERVVQRESACGTTTTPGLSRLLRGLRATRIFDVGMQISRDKSHSHRARDVSHLAECKCRAT